MIHYLLRRLALLPPTLLILSLATFVLLRLIPGDPAQVMLGEHATAAQVAHIRAAHPAAARSVELTAALIPVLALLLAVAVGSYVVGRRGDRTNARHGMLSGGLTVMIFWVVTGRLWSLLPLVPLAMALGHLAGRWGVARRDRSLATEG